MRDRYIVAELEGYAIGRGTRNERLGLSVHVIDTAWNHRVVQSWRTEDYGGRGDQRRIYIRRCAERRAAELNGSPVVRPLAATLRHMMCRNGHLRTPETTYVQPSTGKAECLICKRAVQKAADARRSAKRRAARDDQ